MSTRINGLDWDALKQRLENCRSRSLLGTGSSGELLERAFRERAEALARRGQENKSRRELTPSLEFRISDERFCIDLSRVAQVFPLLPITPVPGSSELLLGVALMNGELRSVIDAGRLLHLAPASADAGCLVLARVEGELFGLLVDAVDRVRPIELDGLIPLDGAMAGSAQFARGLTEDRSVLLDMRALASYLAERCGSVVSAEV